MRKKIILLTLPVLIPLLIFVGCATDRNAVQRKEVPPMTLSEQGITLTLNYLTEDQLIVKFGKKNNPFIAPPSVVGINQEMVFELSVESQPAGEILLKEVELQFGGKAEGPKNIFHLTRFWEVELTRGDTAEYTLGRMKQVIKKNLLPNKTIIKPGSGSTGLVAFLGKFPRYGNFTLYIPVFNKNGKMIHNFRFDFEL